MTEPSKKSLNGVAELEAATATVIALAERTLEIFASTLSAGYNSRERADLLRAFLLANPRNRLRIALHDASNVHRDFPRLIALVRMFSNATVICETGEEAKMVQDEFVLADDRHCVRRFHKDHSRGEAVLYDSAAAQETKRRFDEIWAVSTPAVATTTLGL
jgi:hypothetical protein